MPTDDRQKVYLKEHETMLTQLKAMWEDPMVQLYSDANLPTDLFRGSVFLAGPTSRHQVLHCNWRSQAVAFLRHYGYTGWIFCPEPRGLELANDFTERGYIHTWESDRLMGARLVAFWIPRKADELLGLNTNLELGIFLGHAMTTPSYRKKIFVGWPHEAERMGLPSHYAEMANIYQYTSLEELCQILAGAAA
jgi:hypothetical protein